MNAKIKELAEQVWPGLPENWQDSQSGTVIGINEFAELIVRECAYFSMVATDDHYDVEALYKHFGIDK